MEETTPRKLNGGINRLRHLPRVDFPHLLKTSKIYTAATIISFPVRIRYAIVPISKLCSTITAICISRIHSDFTFLPHNVFMCKQFGLVWLVGNVFLIHYL